MHRGQFTFYRSFWEAARLLPPEDRLSVLEGIARYALDGEESALSDVGKAMFLLIKPTLDTAAQRANSGAKEKPDADKGEAKPEQNANKRKTKPKQSRNKKEKEKETETEKEIETDSEKESENETETETETEGEGDTRRGSACLFVPAIGERPIFCRVRDYCKEIGSAVDPFRFCDYYDKRAWCVNGEPIRDWKALLRSWDEHDFNGERRNEPCLT